MRWLVLFPLLGLSILACSKETQPSPPRENSPPEILSVEARPARVLASQDIYVTCRARDRDKDFLKYWWTASAGSFPEGSVLSTVAWRSPPRLGSHLLTVWVTDFADTISAPLQIETVRVAPPDTLSFVNGANLIALEWAPSPDAAVAYWSGYEVYAAPHTLVGAPPESLLLYLRTPVPVTRLEYRILSIEPGVKLFVHVRSRRDYQGVAERSEAGPEIDTAPRLDGFGQSSLFEIGSRRGPTGVHLPGGSVEAIDPTDVDRIDLYLGTADPNDAAGELRLKSPSLLAYRDPAWAARVTGFQSLGSDWDTPVPPGEPYLEEVEVAPNRVYGLWTAGGHHAKFRILELRGAAPERRVEFQWAWQPLPDYPRY